jgi:hypothetical protein
MNCNKLKPLPRVHSDRTKWHFHPFTDNLFLHVKTSVVSILLLFQTNAGYGMKGDINSTEIYSALQTKHSAGTQANSPM